MEYTPDLDSGARKGLRVQFSRSAPRNAAQSVEQQSPKPQVEGSSPSAPAIWNRTQEEKGAAWKVVKGQRCLVKVRILPVPPNSRVAQMDERWPVTSEVAGSIPVTAAI